jgi:hypothetical protein
MTSTYLSGLGASPYIVVLLGQVGPKADLLHDGAIQNPIGNVKARASCPMAATS